MYVSTKKKKTKKVEEVNTTLEVLLGSLPFPEQVGLLPGLRPLNKVPTKE